MLSPEQIKARAGRLTASRIGCLVTGNTQQIFDLWLEMTGDPRFTPEDVSQVWAVRLGECTEPLQLDWFEQKNGLKVSRRGEVAVHPDEPWAACTLDGWVED